MRETSGLPDRGPHLKVRPDVASPIAKALAEVYIKASTLVEVGVGVTTPLCALDACKAFLRGCLATVCKTSGRLSALSCTFPQ